MTKNINGYRVCKKGGWFSEMKLVSLPLNSWSVCKSHSSKRFLANKILFIWQSFCRKSSYTWNIDFSFFFLFRWKFCLRLIFYSILRQMPLNLWLYEMPYLYKKKEKVLSIGIFLSFHLFQLTFEMKVIKTK